MEGCFSLRKKKALNNEPSRLDLYQSLFGKNNENPLLKPALAKMIDTSGDAGRTKGSEYARVFESTQKVSPSSNELMDAYQVLKQAQTILGPISRPFNKGSAPYRKTPIEAVRIELDLQKTMEASMVQGKGVEIWQSYEVPKKTALNFCIDTSLSMTGEKLFHTAVALAVALLQFRDCPAAVMSFENENFFHLVPSREYSILHVLRSFLRSPMKGYTDLEKGLRGALGQARLLKSKYLISPATLLITDGKPTAGADPNAIACCFDRLIVLKMGGDEGGRRFCQGLAKSGQGVYREVNGFYELPQHMYEIVKQLLATPKRHSA